MSILRSFGKDMQLLQHLERSWVTQPFTQIFVLGALLISFSILNFALICNSNFGMMTQSWGQQMEMNVYLTETSKPLELEQKLKANPMVEKIKFISKQEAIGTLQSQISKIAPEMSQDLSLMSQIPDSFNLELRASNQMLPTLLQMKELAATLKQLPGIDDVQFGENWIQQFGVLIGSVRNMGVAGLAIILVGCFFMISFVIRNSVALRKDEIEILELIGATKTYIRTPYIVEGALMSSLAGVASIWISGLIFGNFQDRLAAEDLFSTVAGRLVFLSPVEQICVFLVFAVLGSLASWLSVAQLNTGYAAAARSGS